MGKYKNSKKTTDRFAKWIKSESELPSWIALTSNAQAAYMHLKVHCFAEGVDNDRNNNGNVRLSAGRLAGLMGIAEKTASAALADLQAKGWIVCKELGYLGFKGKATAPAWRLTMLRTREETPTREAKYWKEGSDFKVEAYPKSKPKPRKGRSANFKKSKSPSPNREGASFQIGGNLVN